VWSFRDVTQRNRLQRQLLASQKLESIGTLAGGIAHDFNNLLAVVLGNASIYLRDKSLPVKLRSSLEDIVDAAERGSSLTHQLLAYARGGLQRLGPVDLNTLVDSVIQMLRRTSPPQLEFVLELTPHLPAIHADPSQIEHVIMNLCLNAVQASEPPCAVVVKTSLEQVDAEGAASLEIQPGQYVLLRVCDSGCGMSAETMERVFEPFFTTKFTGRGMGLAAAQGIVTSHCGQIRVESTLGAGTTMAVWLPVSAEPAQQRERLAAGRSINPPTGSETILILDDDVAIIRTVSQILHSLGYCVVSHTDADEALAFLASNSEDVHLVIQDLNVPRFTGRQVFELIRERAPDVPILLASGFDEPQLAQNTREWGGAGYLQKPFSISILAKMIRKVLDETALRERDSD
jgi:nitrogen-specific signal transduction histidine kinase/ActR/RegA family two-component response regulator